MGEPGGGDRRGLGCLRVAVAGLAGAGLSGAVSCASGASGSPPDSVDGRALISWHSIFVATRPPLSDNAGRRQDYSGTALNRCRNSFQQVASFMYRPVLGFFFSLLGSEFSQVSLVIATIDQLVFIEYLIFEGRFTRRPFKFRFRFRLA